LSVSHCEMTSQLLTGAKKNGLRRVLPFLKR
jgi:hypothetical protein